MSDLCDEQGSQFNRFCVSIDDEENEGEEEEEIEVFTIRLVADYSCRRSRLTHRQA